MVLASNSIRVAALSKPFVPMLLSYYWIAAVVSLGSIRAAEPIAARDTKIDNVGLHYLTAGKGPAVLLLHGYAETSRMWRPLIPKLSEKFMVIAPDLPGIGDSSIPPDKIDMISAAERIHAVVRSLGSLTKPRSWR
ncbi:MAG: hypothetical protein DMF27_15085 [Verrucomicrobia bacterium]|nr:MAG: hypothetical protein DMF27_15085 [Verrucomicrobiota bacterium]